jgi:hypothetical protein
MGGDTCHFPGNYRPTKTYPLPDALSDSALDPHFPVPCPCSLFTTLHQAYLDESESHSTLFSSLSKHELTVFADHDAATRSVKAMQEFEESPDVLVAIAHDMALIDLLPLLNNDPGVDINDWETQGLKEKARWFWLNELPRDGKPGRKPFVDGRYWNGKKISSFTDCV